MLLLGPGRRFVPGVAAGICRRPHDRPKAETHPPNVSMNVCLVDSRYESPGACKFLLLLYRPFRVPLVYPLLIGHSFVLL